MLKKIKECVVSNIVWYIKGLLFEEGEPSLTRFIALASFSLFALISCYLVLFGMHWDLYPNFAAITGGGGIAAQTINKIADSKYNSKQGEGTPSAYAKQTPK